MSAIYKVLPSFVYNGSANHSLHLIFDFPIINYSFWLFNLRVEQPKIEIQNSKHIDGLEGQMLWCIKRAKKRKSNKKKRTAGITYSHPILEDDGEEKYLEKLEGKLIRTESKRKRKLTPRSG